MKSKFQIKPYDYTFQKNDYLPKQVEQGVNTGLGANRFCKVLGRDFKSSALTPLVCYTAVFSVVTQRSSPTVGRVKRVSRERASEGPFFCPRGFAARSRVLARLVSLAQIGELARIIQSPNVLKTLHNVTVVIKTHYTTNLFIVDI